VTRFLADEDLHRAIVIGLRRRRPDLEFVESRDVGLGSARDPDVLRFAADHGYLLVTHDTNTMIDHALQRSRQGLAMPGLLVVPQGSSVGPVVAALVLIAEALADGEWEGQVRYLPF
jgi:hypothetical protein